MTPLELFLLLCLLFAVLFVLYIWGQQAATERFLRQQQQLGGRGRRVREEPPNVEPPNPPHDPNNNVANAHVDDLERPLRASSAAVSTLNRYDFESWLDSLRFALTCDHSILAIEAELPQEDPRNIAACTRIRNSVPPALQSPIVGVRVAFVMVRNLAENYAVVDYLALSELESTIRDKKLISFDAASVDKHLEEVQRKLNDLQVAGGAIAEAKKCSILASTLPSARGTGDDRWSVVRNGLNFGVIPFEQGLASVRKCAKEVNEESSNLVEGKALSAQSRQHINKNKQMNRPWRNGPRKCYSCESTEHIISDCPRFKAFIQSNKDNGSSYVLHSRDLFLDSGASFHHLTTTTGFSSLKPVTGLEVVVADGSSCPVEAVGDAVIQTTGEPLVLKKARLTPGLDSNLVSVPQLTDDGCTVVFDKKKASIIRDGQTMVEVPRCDDLYVITEQTDQALCCKETPDYHSIWGHPSEKKLKELQKLYPQIKATHPKVCEPCILGKQRQKPYLTTPERITEPLEVVHVDICDAKCRGYDGALYYLIIVDESSKFIETVPLKSKSSDGVLAAFIAFKTTMERQTGYRLKSVRSDNGGEFQGRLEQYLDKEGIRHQLTVPYCHSQNGSAERAIQTITTKARVMMKGSCMPDKFWPLAIRAAVCLYNLTPHSALPGMSPFKCLFPRALDLIDRHQQLHIFGSRAYPWISPEKRNIQHNSKFDAVSKRLVFVGYDQLDNSNFLILDPETKTVSRERNVKVIDGDFPFCEKSLDHTPAICQHHSVASNSPVQPTHSVVFFDEPIPLAGGENTRNELPVNQVGYGSPPSGGAGSNGLQEVPHQQPIDVDVWTDAPEVPHQQPIDVDVWTDAPEVHPVEVQNANVEPVVPEIPTAVVTTQPEPVGDLPPPIAATVPPPSMNAAHPHEESTDEMIPALVVVKDETVSVKDEGRPEQGTSTGIRRTRTSADQEVISQAPENVVSSRLRPRVDRAKIAVPETRALSFNEEEVPMSLEEALKTPEADLWKEAADEEMIALMQTHTFEEVDEEGTMDILPSRFVLTAKRKPGGPIDQLKARCVCGGHKQKAGINFWETYSPTSFADSIRLFLTVCLINNMQVHQMDVKSAFLNGDVDGEIFVRPPKPYRTPGKVWRLNKALYGLKQAPRLWKAKLDSIMAEIGFKPTRKDSCIFVKKEGTTTTFILSYVDDLLVASTDAAVLEQTKKKLMGIVDTRDLGEINVFLGVKFTRIADGTCLKMSQSHYIDTLVRRYDLERERPVTKMPALHSIDLSISDPAREIDEGLPFRELLGGLLYIANHTRPDISVALSLLARHMDKPTRKVWTYAKQVLGYLKETKDLGLILGKLDNTNLVAYADANFAPMPDRKSQSGAVLKLAGSTVSWFSRKQKLVATATAEAEFIALGMALKKVTWAQQLLEELFYPVQYPTPMYEDNMPALKIATNRKDTELSKSIDIKYHAIQDFQLRGVIDVKYVKSEDQLADAFTKVPSRPDVIQQLLGKLP